MLLSQLLRRACYVAGEVGRAATGSACNAAVVVDTVLLIARSDLASPAAGFLALAVAAAVSLPGVSRAGHERGGELDSGR